jgi:hypothetical protein
MKSVNQLIRAEKEHKVVQEKSISRPVSILIPSEDDKVNDLQAENTNNDVIALID